MLVNMVVAGLEIAASVAFTFVPPLLLKSGYSETQMTIIFGIGKSFVQIQMGFKIGKILWHPIKYHDKKYWKSRMINRQKVLDTLKKYNLTVRLHSVLFINYLLLPGFRTKL